MRLSCPRIRPWGAANAAVRQTEEYQVSVAKHVAELNKNIKLAESDDQPPMTDDAKRKTIDEFEERQKKMDDLMNGDPGLN